MTPSTSFWLGVKKEFPIAIGIVPFGILYGVLAYSAGIPPTPSIGMSSIVFAGSSQFIAVEEWTNSPIWAIWIGTFAINIRHLLYSASLAPHIQHLPNKWKWILAYLLTDEAYVPTSLHYQDDTIPLKNKHWFWLGAGFTLWGWWQISTIIGVLFPLKIPDQWGFDLVLAITFLGMIVPLLQNKPKIASAVTAAMVGILCKPLPYSLYFLFGAIAGITVGLWLELRGERK